jgi:DNA-binding XRE family transcriptional regulator
MSDDGAPLGKPRRRAPSSGRKRRQGSPLPRPPTPLDVHLGSRLRLLRIARGFSREEMASLAGLTARDLRDQERGIKRIPAEKLVEYAELLEVRLSRFFADVAPRPLPDHSLPSLPSLVADF